ncbi:MAG: methylenetetrahydrofolate--tRNA-(uracil(54)-C(5))-methyltransferase (FADH(2)-oxidizing) TrmFO [Thermodesulfobacteriota bacterium]|nr:methylenetetrahydrofolate--tRNA-(uracil(54)-C(5))-methyltransferase (FADH(2)-oxidizing) TrmFO [Thermodesulfobacteriota bacterium]
MTVSKVTVIGGGLAGCEAAWRLAKAGLAVDLHEMKPKRFSPAHKTPHLAELVCSNSLRSNDLTSAVGLLKEEMRRLGSLVMAAADETRVPAGRALAVDREKFAALITARLGALDKVTLIREEITDLDPGRLTILATGPLTSKAMSDSLSRLIGAESLYFYDAIAPIVTAESINMDLAFEASRYDESNEGDYINCPMTEAEYLAFYEALTSADKVTPRDFENPRFFEGCLPIEVMAERGTRTLTFGPMKPVGLTDPRTGRRPFAVLQLRKENSAGTIYNIVGFQTRLKRPDQDRVFRLIPGLERAEFVRYGSVHRNTFIHGPAHLNEFLQLKKHPNIFPAGQITGVEGYVESSAMGILAGENAGRLAGGEALISPPPTTAHGALVRHLTDTTVRNFQPMNVNYGLVPTAGKEVRKKDRPAFYARRALTDLEAWLEEVEYDD